MRRILKQGRFDVLNTHSGRDSLLAAAARLSGMPLIVRTRHLALAITSRATYTWLPHKVVAVSQSVMRYLVSEGVPQQDIVTIYIYGYRQAAAGEPREFHVALGTGSRRGYRDRGHGGDHARQEGASRSDPRREAVDRVAVEPAFCLRRRRSALRRHPHARAGARACRSRPFTRLAPRYSERIGGLRPVCTANPPGGAGHVVHRGNGVRPAGDLDDGGRCEVIDDGVNGLLVSAHADHALAAALLRLVDALDERRRMGEAGLWTTQTRFSVDTMASEMATFYRSSLSERGAA